MRNRFDFAVYFLFCFLDTVKIILVLLEQLEYKIGQLTFIDYTIAVIVYFAVNCLKNCIRENETGLKFWHILQNKMPHFFNRHNSVIVDIISIPDFIDNDLNPLSFIPRLLGCKQLSSEIVLLNVKCRGGQESNT